MVLRKEILATVPSILLKSKKTLKNCRKDMNLMSQYLLKSRIHKEIENEFEQTDRETIHKQHISSLFKFS